MNHIQLSSILEFSGSHSGVPSSIANRLLYEPSRGKTNNVVSEQVRHKPACTSTEKS